MNDYEALLDSLDVLKDEEKMVDILSSIVELLVVMKEKKFQGALYSRVFIHEDLRINITLDKRR